MPVLMSSWLDSLSSVPSVGHSGTLFKDCCNRYEKARANGRRGQAASVHVARGSLCHSDGSLCSLCVRRPSWRHVLLSAAEMDANTRLRRHAACSLACGAMEGGCYSERISLHGLILFNPAISAAWYGQNAPGRAVCTPALLPTRGGAHSPTHSCVCHAGCSGQPVGPAFICRKARTEPRRQ